jgi:hypothetical protein
MPSACSVTVRNTVNHLSSFSSSRKTSLSSCTLSHSDMKVARFRRSSTISLSSLEASGVGVDADCERGWSESFTSFTPCETDSRRSSRAMRAWSMTPVAEARSPED